MTSEQIKTLDKENVMQTYGRFDVVIDHGVGSTLYSPEGREYIDFASGIGVNSVGYGNERWLRAITDQAAKLAHISNLYYSEPYARLASILTARTGMADVFFANGGGEANEGLIKLARKYSYDKYGLGRATILTLVNSFHGRTITTLKATGQEVFHQYFFPFTEGFRYAEANDIASVRAQAGDDVCAVLLELVQGEGGVMPLERDFVDQVKALCEQNDWLLLVDEVQTGVGRTGTLFAFQQYGLLPDACSFAKGIAGGLPMSGIMANEKCRGVLTPGTHATTFGGNPVSAAAGIAVQEILDDDALAQVREKGDYLRARIEGFHSPAVAGVRGLGLMLGVQLREGYSNAALCADLAQRGLLALTAGQNVLRLLPPLVITREELDRGLSILKDALAAL
ncbi:MAG: aspartate aminotransferase family protein [Oscillospiraceae bacterium]|nr:aspartate aminotransferase family protein [Oscillospiraceae bacterium]